MEKKLPIGIIGAMDDEVAGLISRLEGAAQETFLGIKFYTGTIASVSVIIAKCGVGKVFAAMCASAMIMRYSPRIIVNTGVGGALCTSLCKGDIVVAERLVQHDMDTSAIGDPKGLVSGINKIFFDADSAAVTTLLDAARALSIPAKRGVIATGDIFVADGALKERIVADFSASVCEMEGGAIAQVCYTAGVPFTVVRAISDGADGDAPMDFPTFVKAAAKNSQALVLALLKEYK